MELIYWEPQTYNNRQGYKLGIFDNSGKPTVALNAFKLLRTVKEEILSNYPILQFL